MPDNPAFWPHESIYPVFRIDWTYYFEYRTPNTEQGIMKYFYYTSILDIHYLIFKEVALTAFHPGAGKHSELVLFL